MVIIDGNGNSEPYTNPGRVCISDSASNLGKSMNPTILLSAMIKLYSRLSTLTFVWQHTLKKENPEFKSIKLLLEIDLVSYPARAKG